MPPIPDSSVTLIPQDPSPSLSVTLLGDIFLVLREFWSEPKLFVLLHKWAFSSLAGRECGDTMSGSQGTSEGRAPPVWGGRRGDYSTSLPHDFSTPAQELQPTACGAALRSSQANLKQPLNKQIVVFAFWVVYHHIFDVIFSLGEIIFLKQISWLPGIAVWATGLP